MFGVELGCVPMFASLRPSKNYLLLLNKGILHADCLILLRLHNDRNLGVKGHGNGDRHLLLYDNILNFYIFRGRCRRYRVIYFCVSWLCLHLHSLLIL
jgi:hypothetical protein